MTSLNLLDKIRKAVNSARDCLPLYVSTWESYGSLSFSSDHFSIVEHFINKFVSHSLKDPLSVIAEAPIIDFSPEGCITIFWIFPVSRFHIKVFLPSENKPCLTYYFEDTEAQSAYTGKDANVDNLTRRLYRDVRQHFC